ncbi:phosphotransferase [Micromonospora sp. NPDC049645]|uniref:phosphotransferase n=1 Tax=Micromonospora sp. NPDC049645 TaxID=3155508 RepID=UPI0034198B67
MNQTRLPAVADREAVRPGDARAGAMFERFTTDGVGYFVKRWSHHSDWLARVTGDDRYWPLLAWNAGLMGRARPFVDHCIESIELAPDDAGGELVVLMRDAAADLIPDGHAPIAPEQEIGLLTAMAELDTRLLGWRDDVGLMSMRQRLLMLSPANLAGELARPGPRPGPVAAADEGWRRLAAVDPPLARLLQRVHDEPERLIQLLRGTPAGFVHGDWKMGNLGLRADGEVVLLDWSFLGEAPLAWDICWYLALNRERLVTDKDETLDRFRRLVDERGVRTAGWWDEQVALCVVGVMAVFGWEKALGDGDELAWWSRRCQAVAHRLRL